MHMQKKRHAREDFGDELEPRSGVVNSGIFRRYPALD